jgi:MFS transporter, DHA1 family, inner membrane transport protein
MKLIIFTLALANFGVGTGGLIIAGVLPQIAASLVVSLPQAGALLGYSSIAYALGAPLLGAALWRIDRKQVLLGGLWLMTVASVVGALSTDYTVVLISRVVFAAASAVVTPTTLSVVAFLTTPETRGKAISKVFGGFALSNVIGLPLGVMIAAVSDWHLALWYAAIVSAAAALMVGKYLPRNIQVPPSNFAMLGAFMLDWRKMAVVSIVVLQMAAVFTVYTYLTAWLTETLGLSRQSVTLMLLWFGLFGTIGVFSSGELMQRFNNHRLMVVLLIALAAIHSSFSWIPASIPLVMLTLALWGLFGFAFQPAQQTRVIQVAGTSANAGITLHASGVYVGQAFGAFVGGAMLAGGGMSSLGWAAAAVALLALGLMLITFRTTRSQITAK